MDRRLIRALVIGVAVVIGIALVLAFYNQILGALISIGILVGIAALILSVMRRAFRR